MKKVFSRTGSTLVLALAVLTSAGGVVQADEQPLRFATALGYPPFEYMGPDGKMTGFEIDLGNAICKQLKRTCTWSEIEFSGMAPGLQARKFDAMIASVAVTEDRRKQVLFTDKVYGSHTRLLARKASGVTSDVQTLKGKRIGVEQGTINERFAKNRWTPQGVEVVSYPDQDIVYNDLIGGRLDGVIVADLQAQLGFLSTERGADFGFVGDAIADPLIGDNGSAIAVGKGNQKLAEALNGALAALHADGTYDRLAAQYFPPSVNVYGE